MKLPVFFKLFILFLLVLNNELSAQIPVPPGWYHEAKPHQLFRGLLSRVHFEITPGIGRTFFRHSPEGLAVYSGAQGVQLFNPTAYNPLTDSIGGTLTQWVNTSIPGQSIYVGQDDFILSTDTVNLKMKGKDRVIPMSISAYIIIDRFKIGGGFSFDPHFMGSFNSNIYQSRIQSWKPDVPVAFFKHYYGIFGANIYRYMDWMFSGDLRIGTWNPGKNYNLAIIQKGININLGFGMERELSEYLSLYLRPSFELKSYTLAIPESSFSIKHKLNAYRINFGIIWRLPELPKCFIKRCHIQINHQHGDREYRSRMHPFWKKQNPNYGENYPTLLMYKKNLRRTKSVY